MPSITSTVAWAALGLPAVMASTSDPFNFCTENQCEKCPVSLASSGTGYPRCVVYQSKNIFPGQGFKGSDGGGTKVFLDVKQPDKDCQIIVRSPADTTSLACGVFKASFSHSACATLDLDKTFMVQYCCGDVCEDAGLNGRHRFAVRGLDARGTGGLYLKDDNGTVIEPYQVGEIPDPQNVARMAALEARKKKDDKIPKGKCKGDWKETDSYTKPADNVQIVSSQTVSGAGDVQITKTRSQSWSKSSSLNLGIADIISLGAGLTEETSKEKSDSQAYTFHVSSGQTGDVGFTTTMQCTKGSGTCYGDTYSGEICWPIYDEDSETLKGTTSLIIHD